MCVPGSAAPTEPTLLLPLTTSSLVGFRCSAGLSPQPATTERRTGAHRAPGTRKGAFIRPRNLWGVLKLMIFGRAREVSDSALETRGATPHSQAKNGPAPNGKR